MTVDHKSGFVAEGGGQVNNGYGNRLPPNVLTGVNVSGTQIGVIGNGPTGVQGQGQGVTGIGVQGQAAAGQGIGVQGQGAAGQGIGVQGTGVGVPGIGVQGDSVPPNTASGSVSGTGVSGQSQGGGVGVIGSSTAALQNAPTPYIGVLGQAQTGIAGALLEPYPADQDYITTGVFGIGDRYGAVFQTTPVLPGAMTFANVQLTPVEVKNADPSPRFAQAGEFLPSLPGAGKAGDIVAVDVQIPGQGSDPNGIQLWVCIKSAVNEGGGIEGNATWARIRFDIVITTP